MDDNLLTRIAAVCDFYRGARWGLSYDSMDGGEWSLSIISASEAPPEEDEDPIDRLLAHVTQQKRNSPVFRMSCSSLEVICSSLEHWHASTLAKDL